MQAWKNVRLKVNLQNREGRINIDQAERLVKDGRPPVPYRRYRHRLGPALDMTFPRGDASTRMIAIWPEDTPAHRKVIINLSATAAKNASSILDTLTHMAESVRLVDK